MGHITSVRIVVAATRVPVIGSGFMWENARWSPRTRSDTWISVSYHIVQVVDLEGEPESPIMEQFSNDLC
jgi:hypothetical protein